LGGFLGDPPKKTPPQILYLREFAAKNVICNRPNLDQRRLTEIPKSGTITL
jgi:hypothetical protein